MTLSNYCAAIYKGIFIVKESDNNTRVSSCCINTLGPETSVIDFEKDPYLVEQRQKFDAGGKPSSCEQCWSLEDMGLPSRRSRSIKHSPYQDPLKVELMEMHYNVPPLCNAKCITCGSHYSSAWAAEDDKFNVLNVTKRSFNQITKSEPQLNLNYSKLKQIYFNGGEPFLSKDVSEMLTKIKEQKGTLSDIGLVISTNGSIMPASEDSQLWNECQAVTFLCSIEAVGSQFEYIRYPLKWDEVSQNVANFSKLFNTKFTLTISPNVGIHNVLEYPKLVEWVKQLKTIAKTEVLLRPSMTLGPYLSFNTTSSILKDCFLQSLPDGPDYETIRSYIANSKNCPNEFKNNWVNWLNEIDRRRGLNWRETFPGLVGLEGL
jgi:organic radical activating enzyme